MSFLPCEKQHPVDGSKPLQIHASLKQSHLQTFKCDDNLCVCGVLQVPMEYNHLQEISIMALRNRLLLLHHFSELFCPCIPMFDLEGRLGQTGHGPSVGFDTLRGILISQGKVGGLCFKLRNMHMCRKHNV